MTTPDLLEASNEVSRDLSPKWLELSAHVRRLAGEHASGPATALANEARLLCDHVERLHFDVEQLLVSLESESGPLAGTLEARDHESSAIDLANLRIQEEMHEKSDIKKVIKALFMWKDDPVERVRERVD